MKRALIIIILGIILFLGSSFFMEPAGIKTAPQPKETSTEKLEVQNMEQ